MPKPKQGTHFWRMAIQAPATDRTTNVIGGFGTWTPKRGQTRHDVCEDIRDALTEKYPEAQGGVVIAFDIQPNKL